MRNYFLDYYKIMLAIFVVGIHTSPFLEYSKPFSFIFNLGVFRLAVPSFFLINGYYATNNLSSKYELKLFLIRIFKIYLFWMMIYFPLFLCTHDFSTKNVLWGFIVLTYGYGHLWYLTALLCGMVLLYYFKNKYSKKTVLMLAITLYITGCSIELLQLYLSTINSSFITEIMSLQIWKLNFIFFAFPFLSLGYYMKNDPIEFAKSHHLFLFLCLFIFELILSYYFLPHGRNMLFSLLLIAPSIFFYLISKTNLIKNSYLGSCYIDKLPNSIYYVHGVINFFSTVVLINITNTNRFIIVSICSIICGILVIKLDSIIKTCFSYSII